MNNYRLISLLPSLSRIFERIIYQRIYAFFEQFKLFNNYQYGFRSNHSTVDAIGSLVNLIQSSIHVTKPLSAFLDLKKAFDTVSFSRLTLKLERYGIRGPVLEFLRSYLSNRRHHVEHQNLNSSILPTEYGFPQGSILGRSLFLYTLTILTIG